MRNDEEKNCKNCNYYRQHYLIRHANFIRADGWTCMRRKISAKCADQPKQCKYWENNESAKLERNEHIKNTLREMNEHLNQIEQILKDDTK